MFNLFGRRTSKDFIEEATTKRKMEQYIFGDNK